MKRTIYFSFDMVENGIQETRRSMESTEDAKKFIEANRYPIPEKGNPRRYISRCIDERYPSEKDLPALAIPGADIGQIVTLFAAANKANHKY